MLPLSSTTDSKPSLHMSHVQIRLHKWAVFSNCHINPVKKSLLRRMF